MERRRIPFSSRQKGPQRLLGTLFSLAIQAFVLINFLSVATQQIGVLIVLMLLIMVQLNTLYQARRLAFTGWLTAEGFEMQTFWLATRYVPLPEFVRVEHWLRDYRIVFRNIPSVYIRRTDQQGFWKSEMERTSGYEIELANQLIGEYIRTAYAENPALFRHC